MAPPPCVFLDKPELEGGATDRSCIHKNVSSFSSEHTKKIGSSSWRCSFSEIVDGAETVPNKFQAGWVVYGAQPK
jgi:hypothetical protein